MERMYIEERIYPGESTVFSNKGKRRWQSPEGDGWCTRRVKKEVISTLQVLPAGLWSRVFLQGRKQLGQIPWFRYSSNRLY